MTGKQMAEMSSSTTDNKEKLEKFFATAAAREIQDYIHNISVGVGSDEYEHARTALAIRLSEDAEISTRRIIRLTWGLIALTVALLVLTVALYKDAHEQIQREQLKEQRNQNRP